MRLTTSMRHDARMRIGCAGWSIPRDSKGLFDSSHSHLERYARVFNACEINSSFYRPHKMETWRRWGESVPADFRFSVKAPRTITHEKGLKEALELLQPFLHQVRFLKERLGPILFQLPPSLEYTRAHARRFLSLLRERHGGEVVWEPRHPTWFVEEVDELLSEFRIARVAADPACVPLAGGPGGWPSLVYFRLHGSPRMYYSSYPDDFLNVQAAKLSSLAGNAPVWCMFDNTALGYSIPNALTLRGKVNREISPGVPGYVRSQVLVRSTGRSTPNGSK
jgi:uncharacterized protein YecE (DUF72 family)